MSALAPGRISLGGYRSPTRAALAALALALTLAASGCLGAKPAPTTPATPTPTDVTPTTPVTTPSATPTPTPTPAREVGPTFFVPLAGPAAAGVAAVGHLDDDEFFDVYAGGASGGKLFKGDGKGGFSDVTDKLGVACAACGAVKHAAIGDVDEDGQNDLLVATATGLHLFANQVDNPWPDVAADWGIAGVSGDAVAFADLENDGDLDLAVASANAPLSLWLNEGTGHFARGPTLDGAVGSAFTFTYVDDDALLDLVVATKDGLKSFRSVNGTSVSFTDTTSKAKFPAGLVASSVVAADYDNNQALDLVVAAADGVRVLKNTRIGGAFSDRTSALGLPANAATAAAAFDANNDGWLDVLATGPSGSTLYLSAEGESFAAKVDKSGLPTSVYRSLALGDFDRDGRLDVLALRDAGRATLLANRDDAGPYFTLHLRGNESTFTGVGAKVSLSSGTSFLYRQAGGGGSPSVAMPMDPFFGLGTELVEKYTLAIKWPSGILQFETIEKERVVNRQLAARESASEAPWSDC